MGIEQADLDNKAAALDDLRIDASVAFYEQVMNERITGPQLEGFAPDWLRDALRDPATHTLELGDGVTWPLLVPIRHNQDYRADFFDGHLPGRPAYYFSLPPEGKADDDEAVLAAGRSLEAVRGENGVIVYDRLRQSEDDADRHRAYLEGIAGGTVSDITPESEAFGMTYGQPKVTHFEAIAAHDGTSWPLGDCNTTAAFARLVIKGEYQPVPDRGPTVLTKAILHENDDKLLDDIWDIYSGQFDQLVEDHPSLQIQPREELERMILDEESFNLAYMEDGKVAALCYFVSNIDKCVWLNPAFFEAMKTGTPGVRLAYFPGIVVDKDKARQGAGYVDEMIKLLERVYEEAGMRGMQIVFQCTNVSATYIPKIVTSVISNNGVFAFDQPAGEDGSAFRTRAVYDYKICELSAAES